MIRELLKNRPSAERADIKATEIVKLNHVGIYDDLEYGIKVEIISLVKIDKGIEILARAWKGGKQLGFGKDGSVEIERFRIFNPPVCVDDPSGEFKITRINILGETVVRILKEDLIRATRSSLAHTILQVGKENTNVVLGRVGKTTSTFFPSPTETDSIDGVLYKIHNGDVGESWATVRDNTTAVTVQFNALSDLVSYINSGSSTDQYRQLYRSFITFPTESIPDGDTIDSATLSIYSINTQFQTTSNTNDLNIYQSTQDSATNLVTTDYDNVATTAFSTTKVHTDFTAGAGYKDFALNSSGLTNISKTVASKFTCRNVTHDVGNVAPTWTASANIIGVEVSMSEEAGTTQDPKLVVVHTAATAMKDIIRGPGIVPRKR